MNPKNSSNCFIFRENKNYKMDENFFENKYLPKYIIIDCSMLSYIDTAGVTTLKKLVLDHADVEITVLLAGGAVHIESTLKNDGFFKEVSSDRVFKSVHDAVSYIRDTDPNIILPFVKI